jgi:predicted DNA-binding protein with PD1-like motif
VVVIEIRNAELMEAVAKEAKRLHITNGAIVSLIGAVDSFTISTMPKHDATKDIITDYVYLPK